MYQPKHNFLQTQAAVTKHSFNISTWEAGDKWISCEFQTSQVYIETFSQN